MLQMPHLRIGLAGVGKKRDITAVEKVVKRAACNINNGDLYTYPNYDTYTTSISLPTTNELTFKWNTGCLNSTNVDLYLFAAGSGLIHGYLGIPYSDGNYQATLNPTWWNGSQTADIQWLLVDQGTPRYLAPGRAGPVFGVTVDQQVYESVKSQEVTTVTTGGSTITTQASSTSTDSILQVVSLGQGKNHGLPTGSIVAAIIVPLFVIAIAVGIYVKFARMKEAEKRKRWSEHVDARMSTLSGDWRAGAAIPSNGRASGVGSRKSIALPGDRQTKASSYFGRASSTYAVENNLAGTGSGGGVSGGGGGGGKRISRGQRIAAPSWHGGGGGGGGGEGSQQPEMSQLRSSIFISPTGGLDSNGQPINHTRQSRVSFAGNSAPRMSRVSFGDQPRPSLGNLSAGMKSSPTLTTPEKQRRSSHDTRIQSITRNSLDNRTDISISPSQTQGPFSVSETHLPTLSAKQGKKDGVFGGIVGALGLGKGKKKVEEEKALEKVRTREEEWRQAEMTRRSGDHIRDMEAVMLARRSKAMSGYSTTSNGGSPIPSSNSPTLHLPAPAVARTHNTGSSNIAHHVSVYGTEDDEKMEELDGRIAATGVGRRTATLQEPERVHASRAASPMGMVMPAAGMNPDELLAAYAAARARGGMTTPIGQAIESASTEPASHLRPQSTAGDRNPFRQSMVSDASRYSGAEEDK